MQTVGDARFLEDMKKHNLDLVPLSGEELQKVAQSASDVPSAVVARAQAVHDNAM